jgi:hypothetical protein
MPTVFYFAFEELPVASASLHLNLDVHQITEET